MCAVRVGQNGGSESHGMGNTVHFLFFPKMQKVTPKSSTHHSNSLISSDKKTCVTVWSFLKWGLVSVMATEPDYAYTCATFSPNLDNLIVGLNSDLIVYEARTIP